MSASMSVLRNTACKAVRPTRAHRLVVRASDGVPNPPHQAKDTPASARVSTDAQWEAAVTGAKAASTVAAPSLGDAFAFSGPLPETLNGRLAMLGFVAAVGAELFTGETVFTQFADAPLAVIGTVIAFTIASLAPILKGANLTEAFGPLSPAAEKTNGRWAMLGLAALLVIEYTQGKPLI